MPTNACVRSPTCISSTRSRAASCRPAAGSLVCTLGHLEAGARTSVEIELRLEATSEATALLNVATVRSDVADPDPTNNRSEHRTAVGPSLYLPWLEQVPR